MLLMALIGADQGKTRVTRLDHWTLNLSLPRRRDAVAQCRIKRARQRAHTLAGGTFSLLLSGVTAWVNGLFEVSEDWRSEARHVIFLWFLL